MNQEEMNECGLTCEKDNEKRIVTLKFPVTIGTGVIEIKKVASSYSYNLVAGREYNFSDRKPIWKIGTNGHCSLFKKLKGGFTALGIYPNFEGDNPDDNLDKLNQEIILIEYELKSIFQEWQEDERKKTSWAKVSGGIEHFKPEEKSKAREILYEGSLIEEVLDVAELKVVKQRPKIALTFMIAMSSFLPDPLHNISIAPPAKGKSTITDTLFELFPVQRKENIGKNSTPASLFNMTQFQEGSQVLNDKFIRIGDLGNEEELKGTLPLLSIFKELMSEGQIDKNITDTSGDINETKKLRLEGIGSIHLSTIENEIESQYSSRAIVSSPDDTPEVSKAIKKYQLDDVTRLQNDKEFKKRRGIIAAAIESLYLHLSLLRKSHGTLKIINPYAPHMNDTFKIDESTNANRDRNHIRDLPKTVTLCNLINQTIMLHPDGDIIVVITPEDYLYALKIIGKPILHMLSTVSTQQQSYIRYISEQFLYDEGNEKELHDYSQYFDEEKDSTEEGWLKKTTTDCCFRLVDIKNGLKVSDTSARRIVDALVEKKVLYKKRIVNPNYYFITSEFKDYTETFSPPFYSDEELEIGGEIHQKAKEMYENTVQKLQELGYREITQANSTLQIPKGEPYKSN